MAKSVFHNSIEYELSAIACSHLSLKEEQLSSVKAVYEGKDMFVRLLTGFGKSLVLIPIFSFCFQL